MANKAKRIFLLGTLVASAFMVLTACHDRQTNDSLFDSSLTSLDTAIEEENVLNDAPAQAAFVDASVNQDVEHVALSSITAVSTKETYEYGENLALIVEANYSNGSSEQITDYTCEGYDARQAGKQAVTVRYADTSCTLNVVVNQRFNRFPEQTLASFLLEQGIQTEIPTPVGYESWNGKREMDEDGSYYYYVTTIDEGTPGVDAIEDQYKIILENENWTCSYNKRDGYSALKEQGDAQIFFQTKDGMFIFRVNTYTEYPSVSIFGALLNRYSDLESGDRVVFGHAEQSLLMTKLRNGGFESVDYTFENNELRSLASNVVRFDLKKRGKIWTLSDVRGRKLGATAINQLAWDEGSTDWLASLSDNELILTNVDKSLGRLCIDPETGVLTNYLTAFDTNLIYPQLFVLNETNLVYATDIALEGVDELEIGKTSTLSLSYIPENANQIGQVTWTSSNEKVATVKDGAIQAKGLGSAVITARTVSKGKTLETSFDINIIEQLKDSWTIMVYISGADLESDDRAATADIQEIVSVANQPDDINIIIQTGGSTKWHYPGNKISKDNLCRFHVEDNDIVLDEKLPQGNMGQQSTFESFLTWGLQTYPAEKTGVILWDHGGGLDGVCFDYNYRSDGLLASEVVGACKSAYQKCGVNKLEFIGYDACLMGLQDIAEFNSPYFNYMVASEEIENGSGWAYDKWIDDLYAHKDTKTVLTECCDTFVNQYGSSSSNDQTLALLKLSKMAEYFNAFESFAGVIKSTAKSNLNSFKSLLKSAKCFYAVDSYGSVDAYDALNKIKANATYSQYADKIEEVKTAYDNLVIHSAKGNGAGRSYGLALHACFGYYYDYPSSETRFNNWRNIFVS